MNNDRSKILNFGLNILINVELWVVRIMVWRLAYLLLTQPCCRKWDYGPKSLVMNLLGINLQEPHFPFMILTFSAVGWQSHEMLTPTEWEGK